MSKLEFYKEMQEKFNENVKQYVKEHPGEFVLFEKWGASQLKVTFYKTLEELRNETLRYDTFFGSTFFSKHIPQEISK